MITETVLARKNKGKATFLLLKILNEGNVQYQFKINDNVLWYFKSRYETTEGVYTEIPPPFGISEGKYMIALETLMKICKVA